jgi:hypothetical protein
MITFIGFSQMDLFQQADCLMRYGKCLVDKRIESIGRSLYALEDFYVEMLYDAPKGRIVALIPYRNISSLDDWLNKVDLDELMQGGEK